MTAIPITVPARSHLLTLVQGLLRADWTIQSAPDEGRLERNGQRVILRTGGLESRFRIFAFKVTGSSRGRPDERRIEITTTYPKGLVRLPEYQDVVLGIDPPSGVLVGVDPRRLEHGGSTGNASTFFDREGISQSRSGEVIVRPYATKLFAEGVEYHAFFHSDLLSAYLMALGTIHDGSSTPRPTRPATPRPMPVPQVDSSRVAGDILLLSRPYAKTTRHEPRGSLIQAFESGDLEKLKRAQVTAEELANIKRLCDENGLIGEVFCLTHERNILRKAGKPQLADKVRWISQESTFEGYDIFSYEPNGTQKLIEVKSTQGSSNTFEMSDHEWTVARRAGADYYIYRVTDVRTKPSLRILQNPIALESSGDLAKLPSGWRVTIR